VITPLPAPGEEQKLPKRRVARVETKPAGAKLSRRQEEAILALLVHGTVEEAAHAVKLSPQTLYRWKKLPHFDAAWREARKARTKQGLGRLQKASGVAVTKLIRIVHDPAAPRNARLKAADILLSCRKGVVATEEIGARVWALTKKRRMVKLPIVKTDTSKSPIIVPTASSRTGHGAKFRRRHEEAIMALLTRPNMEEAARSAKIGTTTLYRWVKEPEFASAYHEARLAAFGKAGARLEQAAPIAVSAILAALADPAASPFEQVRACELILKHATGAVEDDIEEWMVALTRAQSASGSRSGKSLAFGAIGSS
jgi:hypothetical protein